MVARRHATGRTVYGACMLWVLRVIVAHNGRLTHNNQYEHWLRQSNLCQATASSHHTAKTVERVYGDCIICMSCLALQHDFHPTSPLDTHPTLFGGWPRLALLAIIGQCITIEKATGPGHVHQVIEARHGLHHPGTSVGAVSCRQVHQIKCASPAPRGRPAASLPS